MTGTNHHYVHLPQDPNGGQHLWAKSNNFTGTSETVQLPPGTYELDFTEGRCRFTYQDGNGDTKHTEIRWLSQTELSKEIGPSDRPFEAVAVQATPTTQISVGQEGQWIEPTGEMMLTKPFNTLKIRNPNHSFRFALTASTEPVTDVQTPEISQNYVANIDSGGATGPSILYQSGWLAEYLAIEDVNRSAYESELPVAGNDALINIRNQSDWITEVWLEGGEQSGQGPYEPIFAESIPDRTQMRFHVPKGYWSLDNLKAKTSIDQSRNPNVDLQAWAEVSDP